MTFYLYSQRSAFRRVARALGVSVCYPYRNRTVQRDGKLIRNVNIGCVKARLPENILNENLCLAISKRKTFEALDKVEVRHPSVFETPEQAAEWEYGWLGRRDGLSGGRGISIFEKGQLPLQAAQFDFIVGIIPGKAEYRVHVGKLPDGSWTTIATQQKLNVRRNESIIRNHDSGVIYSTQPLRMSEKGQARAEHWARLAVEACGLDFAAVDLMQSEDGKLYVLEVNTGPGVGSAPMFNAYLEYFKQWREA